MAEIGLASPLYRPSNFGWVRPTAPTPPAPPDIASVMADMAEELGFIEAEKKRSTHDLAKEGSERLTDAAEEAARRALEMMAKEVPKLELDENLNKIRDQIQLLKQFAFEQAVLEQLFAKFTKGSRALGLLYMKGLEDLAKHDPHLEQLGYGAKATQQWARTYEKEVTAFMHVANVLKAHSTAYGEVAQHMANYERAMVSANSVLGAFSILVTRYGSTWTAVRDLFTKAVLADLLAVDLGGDKIHLQYVLQELKSLRMMRTFTKSLDKLTQNNGTMLTDAEKEELLGLSLEFPEKALEKMVTLDDWLMSASTQEQILFFQGYRNLFNEVITEAYANETQKQDTRAVIQDRIDRLVWEETD